jgi:hypothetical protein
MSRQNATNFAGALQFPYATAGTDIFKKEDVQTLAQAVDQHDHSAGKGLILPASAIPPITSAMITDGTITSADIADGTIATVDLAAHAVSVLRQAVGGSANPTTTSSTMVDMPEMLLTFTPTVVSDVLLTFYGVFYCSVQGALGSYAINVDGADMPIANFGAAVAGVGGIYTVSMAYVVLGMSAASHTVKVRWSTSGGTATANQTVRVLTATEFHR